MIPLVAWEPDSQREPLEPGAVHVWRVSLLRPAAGMEDLSDEAERQRLATLATPTARRRFIASRHALRNLLSRYLAVAPSDLRFRIRPGGKPAIAFPATGIQFNLSHTGDLALLAVALQPVGIDVETLRPLPNALAIARRVLAPDETAALEDLTEPERSRRFLELWTRFEARQKAYGSGVFGDRLPSEAIGLTTIRPTEEHLAAVAWLPPQPPPNLLFRVFAP